MSCQIKTHENRKLTFFFPKNAQIAVKENEEVKKDTLLVSYDEEAFTECDLAKALEIPPIDAKKYLVVNLSSKIEKDQPLASKKTFMGEDKIVNAPVSGEISELTDAGILKIKTKSEKKEINAPFFSKISEIGDIFITLEFKANVIEGQEGCGKETVGELEILGEREKEPVMGDLNSQLVGKILVIGGAVNQGLAHKAETLEIKGLIAGMGSVSLCSEVMPIISIESEKGMIPLDIWQYLLKNKGKTVCLYGKEKLIAFPLEE
jgi:hypothetical protein